MWWFVCAVGWLLIPSLALQCQPVSKQPSKSIPISEIIKHGAQLYFPDPVYPACHVERQGSVVWPATSWIAVAVSGESQPADTKIDQDVHLSSHGPVHARDSLTAPAVAPVAGIVHSRCAPRTHHERTGETQRSSRVHGAGFTCSHSCCSTGS